MAKGKSKFKNKYCADKCGRKRHKHREVCETCKTKRWRAANPIQNAFNCLKASAKKRKKEFAITVEYLTELVRDTGYIEGKGLTAESLTMDRVKNHLGYIPGNLRVITRSANSTKGTQSEEELAAHGIYLNTAIENPF